MTQNNLIEEHAIVVGLEANSALLEIERKQACGLCGKTNGCGVSLLGKLFKHHRNVFKADNQIQAQIGQSVIVGIQAPALLKSAGLIYGVPLIGVLSGAFIVSMGASNSNQEDAYAMVGAFLGLAVSLIWLKFHANHEKNINFQPVILRVDNQKFINISFERSK